MLTTIYNITNIIFCLSLVYLNQLNPLTWYYFILCFLAILIAVRIDGHLKYFPLNSDPRVVEGIHFFFDEQYKIKIINYIGSIACHAIIVGMVLQNFALFGSIFAVLTYRLVVLKIGHDKVKELTNE